MAYKKQGQVFSLVHDNRPLPGCTISRRIYEDDSLYILLFSLGKGTDISDTAYGQNHFFYGLAGTAVIRQGEEQVLREGDAFISEPLVPLSVSALEDTVYLEIGLKKEDKTMKKFIAIVMSLVLIASVAMLAGCGKKDDVKAAKVIGIDLTNENYAFGVDKAQPELLEKTNAFIDKILSDGTFDEICSRYSSGGEPVLVKSAAKDSSKDQLVVATNAAFEPFEYTVGDSYAGIDMEIAKLLADELGKELVIDNMDFDAVCLSVGQHKCDIAMAGLTVNPDREASVTFSKTYYKASQRVVVKGDDTTFDDCKTADDVLKKLQSFDASVKIGYQNGTTGGMYINNESDYASNNLKVTGKGYKNGSLAIQDLINGNINYVIIDSAPADSIVKSINEVA